MERIFICMVLVLGSVISHTTSSVKSDTRVVSRHKRWLWGGCGLIPYCDKCLDFDRCVKCQDGYMFMEYPSFPPSKSVRCTKFCPRGYKIKTKGRAGRMCVFNKKVCMVPHCSTCHPRRINSCNKCASGFYLLRTSVRENAKCVRRCPRWSRRTVRIDGTQECKLRGTECRTRVPNCDLCLDKMWCRKCKKGYLTFFNKSNLTMDCVVKCPSKYAEVKSEYFGQYCQKQEQKKVCRTIPNCKYCPNNASCKSCSKKFLKIKMSLFAATKCVSACPRGFRKMRKRCIPLKGRGCEDEFCSICKPGLYRVTRRLCRKRCPKGHYTVGTVRKLCLKCPRGCQKCISLHHCLKCTKGYARLSNKDGTVCISRCPPGYKEILNRRHLSVCKPVKKTLAKMAGIS